MYMYTALHYNFLQLGRIGGRPQRTVYPRWLHVSCDTHCISGNQTHNLPIVSAMLPVVPPRPFVCLHKLYRISGFPEKVTQLIRVIFIWNCTLGSKWIFKILLFPVLF